MDKKRPQLSRDELFQLKWLLGGALTLLAVSTVFYMEVNAWLLLAVVGSACAATLVWPTLPARIPAVVHTLAFPAIVAFFAADLWLRTEVLPAMVRLGMLLLLYRSIVYRRRRDDLQIVVLGLFLIVVAGVLTVSLFFAVHLLVYTSCALAFLLTITLAGDEVPNEDGDAPPSWAAHANWPALFRRLRDVTDWRIVSFGAALFCGVVAVSALLFLAIPRFQLENSLFLERFITKKAKSGFSESIRFGDVTEIQLDTSVALTVDGLDEAKIPATPYWRMLVLNNYSRGSFTWSRPGDFEVPTKRSQISGARTGGDNVAKFYLESGVSRFLPLPGEFSLLRFAEQQNASRVRSHNLVALAAEPATMTAYLVQGFETSGVLPDAKFATRWNNRRTPDNAIPAEGNVPLSDDAEIAKLARIVQEVTKPSNAAATGTAASALTAKDFAERASAWLRAHHSYTLTPTVPRGGDPLLLWLDSRQAGHCELFAGSLVLLARQAGFAARVVVGFKAGMWNDYSKSFTVRNSDAHAWAEIFDEATGAWFRADPLGPEVGSATPEAQAESARLARVDRSWSARFDSLRVFWYRRIVSFDQGAQAATLKAVKEATQESGRRVRAALERAALAVKAWLASPWDTSRALNLGGGLLVAVAAVWLWRKFGRRWWREMGSGRGGRHDHPIRREAGRWLARMRDASGEKHRAATSETAEVRADLQRLRFGARESWSEPERTFRRARRAVRDLRRAGSVQGSGEV